MWVQRKKIIYIILICIAIIVCLFTLNNKSIKPSITTVEGVIYLNDLTLNDPLTKVIERMGDKYKVEHEDGSVADYVMIYDENIRIYMINNHIYEIYVKDVNARHFNKFFNSFEGIKFTVSGDKFIYSKPSEQLIKLSIDSINDIFHLYFMYPDYLFYELYDF